MFGDVDSQRGFSHGRPCRQYDQVPALKTGRHTVQIIKTSGYSRHVVRVVGHLLHSVEQSYNQGVHALKSLLHTRALLAYVENLLLCLVHNFGYRPALWIEGVSSYFVTGTDELS